MIRIPLLIAALLSAIITGCSPSVENTTWPSKPIVISCFASAGGGTDQVSRLIAKEMEATLGVKINVVNRTAGRGGQAASFVWSKPHDGYHWGGFSESILPASVMGTVQQTAKDWNYFMVAGAPGVLSVGKDSSFDNLDDLISASTKRPGQIKVAASVPSGIWHTKLIALQEAANVTFKYIPFQGSQPSQTAAMSGEVDAVLTSISEQADLIASGEFRPLAMVESEDYELKNFGVITAAAKTYPEVAKVPVSQFLGFAVPSDIPAETLQTISTAFETMMDSPSVAEFAKKRNLELLGKHGAEANKIAQAAESAWVWKLQELGLAEKSPESLGIPKPTN